jgi:alkylation response protein AidB-like acyl-CoA dehydrogenase
MEFSFNEEQKLIKNAARDFLEKECPSDLVREMERDQRGYSLDLWHKMAELGWLGLIFPAKYGGSDGNLLDLVSLIEEMGRYLAPVPFLPTVILGGLSILSAGSEKQKQEFLPILIKGELILTMALTELDFNDDPSGINLHVTREMDFFVIHGTKIFVPYSHVADYLICATRTENNVKKEEGMTLFFVEGRNQGLTHTMLKTMSSDKLCEVIFNRVKVPGENILGKFDRGWEVIKKVWEHTVIAQCALMVGGAERVLEMTVDYAKKRVQFGRPIGSFQAIQHKCADMKVDLDGAKFITYEAAWKMSQGFPCSLEVSAAKAWVNQAYQRICANGHQIYGGIGVMKDQDIQLYSRRAKSAEFLFGDTNFHREIVAQQLEL